VAAAVVVAAMAVVCWGPCCDAGVCVVDKTTRRLVHARSCCCQQLCMPGVKCRTSSDQARASRSDHES
jgi:hypothetical protein